MRQKKYSAFISSVYASLMDERSLVIDALLDHNMIPVSMEHFTASTSRQFKDIEERIEQSDFFILILGRQYGSCDDKGISWTEREFRFALEREKEVLVLFCDELIELRKERGVRSLTEDEEKQLQFSDSISFGREITANMSISRIVHQFLSGVNYSKCAGWSRCEPVGGKALQEWRESHKKYDLADCWYHVHLSNEDDHYVRTGTITIVQEFTPDAWRELYLEGINYSIKYHPKTGDISQNMLKRTRWHGTYVLTDEDKTTGVFYARREFTEEFGKISVGPETRRGIHDFLFSGAMDEEISAFQGEFHDEAPSPKQGLIFVFRDKTERDNFLKEQCPERLNNNI